MDKLSFLKGLALGLAGKPLEFAPGKEPVAYLYNGVRLPKLPESKYPHAYINKYTTIDLKKRYSIIFTDKPVADHTGNIYCEDVYYTQYNCYEADITNGVWTLAVEDKFTDIVGSTHGPVSQIIWSNYDILYADSTVVSFEASDPVPVYE